MTTYTKEEVYALLKESKPVKFTTKAGEPRLATLKILPEEKRGDPTKEAANVVTLWDDDKAEMGNGYTSIIVQNIEKIG